MNSPTPPVTNTKFVEMVRTYWAWRRLWIATTVVFGGIGLLYVLCLKSDQWVASQGLIVRDEANGAVMRLGRFQSQTEMKAAQETILEMARNTQVLREALLEVGPEKNWFGQSKMTESWPSQREVAELAEESIGVRAPKGAEFGTTEVIYLDIRQTSRQRAVDLNRAVCKALDNRLRSVRVARADGVIDELVRASTMATDELQRATAELQAIEREAGADLSDLRGLSENNGASSTSRTQLEAVKTELRQIESQHANLLTDLALLRETQTDPARILSAPASILSLHPGLKKLREGLADAQLSSSQLRGRYADNHPLVFVALSAEKEIKGELQTELALALSAATKEVENSQRRIDSLKSQQQQLEGRLTRLAQIRASHDNCNQEVRSRTKILQDCERQLADTRAARDAALSTSLLTRIDQPVLGERPVGPGRTTILAGLTVAGLLCGLGIVFLLTPLDGTPPSEERWNERLGRRISDRFPWLADQAPGGGPRRRRTDADRRQGNRAGVPASAGNSWFGRRQGDNASATSPATSEPKAAATPSAPVVQAEDPAIANRLEAMLLSELAAVVPAPVNPLKPDSVSQDKVSPDKVSQVVKPAPSAAPSASPGNSESKQPTKPRLVSRAAEPPRDNSSEAASEALVRSQPSPAKPIKPGSNMFRPNQSPVETPPASQKEPQRPRRADGRTPSLAQAAPAPIPAPSPQPLPLPANAFETPPDGGLAGIGLPTQKLPESFGSRQT